MVRAFTPSTRKSSGNQRFDSRQKIMAVTALIVIFLAVGWVLWVGVINAPAKPAEPSEQVYAFIKSAKEALTDGPFADIGVVPSADLTSVIVKGDLPTGADLQELKSRLEKIQPQVPTEYAVGVAKP
jgi:hypothetical protein